MSRRILLAAVAFFATFVGVVLAGDISGTWSGNMQAGDNPVALTFVFKQEGGKLTGTVVSPSGQPLTLQDGKVTGEKLSFFVTADMNGTPTKFVSEGSIKGEEIALNIKVEGGPDFGTTTLKKTK